MSLTPGFTIKPLTGAHPFGTMLRATGGNLGPLQTLIGTWTGSGFNTIWRPFSGAGSDNILELNVTSETLQFTEIPGAIPNRGMHQGDISLFGLTYLQQVSDSNTQEGLHIEPGIWIFVPATTNPAEQQTVVRMASIPHGTTIEAQGVAPSSTPIAGGPNIPVLNITPFIGSPANQIPFPGESTITQQSNFRIPPAAQPQTPPLPFPITQPMVDNPNSVLVAANTGLNIISTTTLSISTLSNGSTPPLTTPEGGGADNIAFLNGDGSNSSAPTSANAQAVSMNATFWIETVQNTDGSTFLQLQYSQVVFLNFNGLTWPHASVATLRLAPPNANRFASQAFPGVYLRIDGSGLSAANPLGGVVNGQFGANFPPITYEIYQIEPQDDGTVLIGSIHFHNVFLYLDGTGVNAANPAGGSVQAIFGTTSANQKFTILPQPDGSSAIQSVAFPNVFLTLSAPGFNQSNGSGGGSTSCSWGVTGNAKFYWSS